MPLDGKGKHHLSTQKAAHANKKAASVPSDGGDKPMAPAGGIHATVHDHGDGTGHTEMADGRQHEHPDMESVKAKLEQLLSEDPDMDGDEHDQSAMPPGHHSYSGM